MKFETGPMQVELTEDGVRCYAETQVTFDDETPEEQLLVYERYRQVVSEELTRYLRPHGMAVRCLNLSYRGLTKEEVERLFDNYIEEKKKNVAAQEHELGQGSDTEVGYGKTEVLHEVQD